MRTAARVGCGVAVAIGLGLAACTNPSSSESDGAPGAGGATVTSSSGAIRINLCDGESSILAEDPEGDPEKSRAVAVALMQAWQEKHPDSDWEMPDWERKERSHHSILPASDNAHLLRGGQAEGHAYANFTQGDLLLWKRETEKLVVRGSQVFHSGSELGSTIGVSCDMCHPDAANTHPETYPKYQAQRGQVSLLRDMINWCVENPVRAPKLGADSEKMRALEAYIIAQRSGKVMEYGKH